MDNGDRHDDLLLSWSLDEHRDRLIETAVAWPHVVTPEWAWGSSTGRGVRICVVDSGVETDHPDVGPIDESWVVEVDADGVAHVVPDEAGDVCGHGTAVAGVIRSIAPDCTLISVRVLSLGYFGSTAALTAGLEWAVAHADLINLSLSTTKADAVPVLSRISSSAYFRHKIIVASANNMRVSSFPWRFASVISVGSHTDHDPNLVLYNPEPPVEFFAKGSEVSVAWLNGSRAVCSGNSFATSHVTGRCARILGAHENIDTHLMKSVLHLTAPNVRTRT